MNQSQTVQTGLGFRARFNIEEHLLDHAKRLKLHISRDAGDTYNVSSQTKPLNIDALCPPYIKHNGQNFELGQLKRFLNFLHHPLEESIIHARKMALIQESLPEANTSRRTAHQIFRHITTGTIEIPDERQFIAHDDHAECHGKVEIDMAIADLWRNESEIGNTNDLPSAIPLSKTCLEKGFGFKILYPDTQNSPIEDWIRNTLSDISDQTPLHIDEHGFLFLNGATLDSFCSRIYNDPTLPDILKAEEFRARIQTHIQNINARKNDPDFLRNIAAHPLRQKNFTEQMNALRLLTTTALTPVLCSGAMQDVWAYYHITQRDEAPIEGLENDFASLNDVIHHFSHESGYIDSATAQAIAHEFYSLLTFSKKACEILNIPQKQTIDQCCMTGIHGNQNTIREKDAELLHTLEKSVGKGHGALKSFAIEGGKSIGNVFMESLHFGTKNWKIFAPLTAGYVYILANPDAQSWMMNAYQGFTPPQPATAENFDVFQENLNLVADPNNKDPVCHLHITAVHCAFNDFMRNMATDTVGYIEVAADKISHATGIFPADKIDNIAYSPAVESQFAISARNAVQPVSSTFLNINLLQWAAHLSFYGTLISRGFKNGISGGFASTKGFFGEVANTGTVLLKEKWPAVSAAAISAPTLAMHSDMNPAGVVYSTIAAFAAGYSIWNRKPSCNKALQDIIEEKNLLPKANTAQNQNVSILNDLTEAAIKREELADQLPSKLAQKPFSLQLSGALSRKFNLQSDTVHSLCMQLENFDIILSHLSHEIGVNYSQGKEQSNDSYKNFLHTKIKSLKHALEDFLENKDQDALQSALNLHLQDVMSAQILHTGSDDLYTTLFKNVSHITHKDDLDYLTNHANARLGKHKRAQAILNHGNVIDLYKQQFPLAPERIKSEIALRSLSLWDDMVLLARNTQKAWNRLPDFKFKTGTSSASSKNITLATTAGIIALMDMTEMADTLLDGKALETFNLASGVLGTTFSTAVFTTTFAGYNLWDDIILNDMVIGFGACLSAGVTANLAYKRGVKPAWKSFQEYIQLRSNKPHDLASKTHFPVEENPANLDADIENSSTQQQHNL